MLNAQLVTAGFFVNGLRDVKPDMSEVLKVWDRGHYELVDALVRYAPLTESLGRAAAKANNNEWPGIFDYEVSKEFGHWFGNYVLVHSEEPPKDQVHAWLIKEITKFFDLKDTAFEAEANLRILWTDQGVPIEKQDALILQIAAKAAPGAMVGPFRIAA